MTYIAKEEWCTFCNKMHPKYIDGCEGFKEYMKEVRLQGVNILTEKEHSWVEEESIKLGKCAKCNKNHSIFYICDLDEIRRKELNKLYKESEDEIFNKIDSVDTKEYFENVCKNCRDSRDWCIVQCTSNTCCIILNESLKIF